MQILLPPSETKREGGSGSLDTELLAFGPALTPAREAVRAALEALCAPDADEETAVKALKLGVKNRGEIARNRSIGSSGIMAAIDRYTGVLYDALDAQTIGAQARAWCGAHVQIQSALFGRVRALDPIPAYRLSASSKLPDLGKPLKRVWAPAHEELDAPAFTLDLRSKDYAQLAPLRAGEGHSLHVAQRGADGQVRALNHFNKAAKGDLVRRLAQTGQAVSSVEELIAWAKDAGLNLDFDGDTLTLVTELGAPTRA
ncbi:cytoplasmic iron level regulating protein YaaA (DUF328/UPF0246 family) [Leucobacter exalbidus]|uniref:Cytoplasmic iron level regulating protein YaaA (DUF328/UPF0246 family) n=1 Tax=Leucobacter exalbidus TaxID=662960 RepID=A0A940PWU5_9MICO|nr:peroxide stress protein YaaA [Leucobacter exalbidus]MBP1325646.1 cytoplasmic iron level regulating protein YaaA (DUF328/UPF0246 family) [Leucobacter exalbidus]